MGGSGGGSSSGEIGFPAYMETIHSDWLDNTGVDTISDSMTDVMNTMLGGSPWTLLSAYDPDADITAYEAAITAFAAILAGISDTVDWAALYTQAEASIGAVSNALIVADEAAFATMIDDQITTEVLPRFEGGMRDINAVVSSAFVVGRSIIEGFRNRDVAKHGSALRLEAAVNDKNLYVNAANQMLTLMLNRVNWEAAYVHTVVESKRIKIVAKKEQTDMDADIDKRDALWDAEVFQYGANLLGSIGSGVVKPDKPSQLQSMLGGAMTGAAAGGMVGGPHGAAAGAVIGAASAFL